MDSPLKRVETDLKTAMKDKDAFRLGVLRMVKSALKNQEIALKRDVNESEFLETLLKLVKQRQDSVAQYEKVGRLDAATQEKEEIQILQSYLPKPLGEDELNRLIQSALQQTAAESQKDMGKVMAALKDSTHGRVDGKILAEKVKQALSNKA